MAILTPSHQRIATVALALGLCAASPVFAQDLSPIDNFFSTLGTALTGTDRQGHRPRCARSSRHPVPAGPHELDVRRLGLVILFGAATMLAGFGTA